ncbi:MAG: glycosyltransferase family 4 protein [Elusimicrobia bacterium]|nr:glycosyltransferase family 4 protein [Elusimicrobiota bacterium]
MKILYHHRTQGHGAEGVHITGIVRGFEKKGHRVVLCSPPGVDPFRTAGDYLYGRKKKWWGRLWKEVSRHLPQILFEGMELGYNLFHGRRLERMIRRSPVDLVYERYAFFLFATARVAKKHRLPLVLEVNEITPHKRARPLLLRKLAGIIERYVFSKADVVVTVSSFLKQEIVRMGIDGDKVMVVPNGVDEKMFSPSRNGRPVREKLGLRGAFVIGFVGWFDPWDNLPGLLRAFRELSRRRDDLRLLLIGDVAGKGMSRTFMTRLIDGFRLKEKILILPRVPRGDIPGHIDAMDLCLIPDTNPFGSPVVLFEYMGMGKPVVAPSRGPIRDVIVHGENGMIFEKEKDDSLLETLWTTIQDEPLRQRVGRRARECVEHRHTWDRNAERILDMYHVVGRREEAMLPS